MAFCVALSIKDPTAKQSCPSLRGFDKTRYELFAYSVGFRDRVVSAHSEFDAQFDGAIDHRRMLIGNPREMRESLLADDLDVFLHANATTFGVRALELALYPPPRANPDSPEFACSDVDGLAVLTMRI